MAQTTPVHSGYTIINGTTSGSNGSKVNTWIEYSVVSQSVANNTSTLNVYLYARATQTLGTSWSGTAEYGSVTVNGTKYSGPSISGYSFTSTSTYNLFSYKTSIVIPHNSDGTKTISISGTWDKGRSSSTYVTGGSVSGSITLPRIARASSINNVSANLGASATITITRQDSSFTHTLTYTFGGSTYTIATQTANTSVSFTPPVSLISGFGANSTSATGTITCTTYSGSTAVGTSTSTLTLSIPSSSLANVTGTFGSACNLTATNACTSGLTYTYAYNNGSSWVAIGSSSNKTQSWTPSASLISSISNASSQQYSIRVITYRGTTAINTATATATISIPKNTSSNRSGTIGTSLSIPIIKSNTNLTSTITYTFGSASGTIATKTTNTSVSWTPPTSLLTQIPSSASGTGTLKIETFNGTASCGSNSYTLTLSAAASVVPTSSFSTTIINDNSTVNGWGIALQSYSKIKGDLNASGVSGSTISSMAITGASLNVNSTPQTSSATLSGTSSVLSTSGSLTYTATVTDSRGRNATTKTSTITVYPYSSPYATITKCNRSDSTGADAEDGTYLRLNFDLNYADCNEHNTASAQLQYRLKGATSWTTFGTVTSGSNLNVNFAVSNNYEVRIVTSDALTSGVNSAIWQVPSAERVLNVNASGSGLAIGGFSTKADRLQIYYPVDSFDMDGVITGGIKKYNSRPTSANLSRVGNGEMSHFLATSSMTEGKPPYDSHVIDMDWDNTTGGRSQIAIRNNNPIDIWIRTNGEGSYGDWISLLGQHGSYTSGTYDANNLITAGSYWVGGSSVSNLPVTAGYGILVCFKTYVADTSAKAQLFIQYGTNRMWSRVYTNSQWYAWTEYVRGSELYYASGDTYNLSSNTTVSGFITSNNTSVQLEVITPKLMTNISTIEVTKCVGALRGTSGYIDGSSNTTDWLTISGITTSRVKRGDNRIQLNIVKSSAMSNVTNNTPVSFYGQLTFTFT